MSEPYSLDLRERAVAMVDEGANSSEVARALRVSDSWVRKMRLRRERLGHLRPGSPGEGPSTQRGGGDGAVWMGIGETGCNVGGARRTLGEVLEGAREYFDRVATSARIRSDAQKKTIHASKADRPNVQRERERFLTRSVVRRATRLLFIDETGINLSMTRAYARAPAGDRAVDAVPKNWGDNITVTAALTLDGIVAPMMLHGAMNACAFEAYTEQCLAPELRPGDVVALDRLNAHKTDRVRELVEAAGARLVFLPAYSPDFNPIENAWSKLKALLRKARARTLRKLSRALRWALVEITSNDAHGWFSHCGFRVPCL
jgi:transposase